MSSPVGHLIAGACVALAADQRFQISSRWPRFVVVCAVLAAVPDLDWLYPDGHRKMTHSLFALMLVLLATMAITHWRMGRVDWRVTVACTLAYATHLVMDYFAMDPGSPAGIQLLWPWSHAWFISDRPIFLATERIHLLSAFAIGTNTLALTRELLMLAPIFVLLWWRRRRLVGRVEYDDRRS